MSGKTTTFFILLLVAVPAMLLAGCKSVRRTEAEIRCPSLDARSSDIYHNMAVGSTKAHPVHKNLTALDLHEPLSLRRSIELGIEGHPEIRRARAKLGESTGRRRELETMGWAELIFDITWSPDWKLGLDAPRDGTAGDRIADDTLRLGVALRQPIYFEWQRRRALLNANTEKLNSLHNQLEVEVNKVVGDVCMAYLDIELGRAQCVHRRNIYELDRKRLAIVEKLVEKRMLLKSSLHKARYYVNGAERDFHEARQILKSRIRKLKNLIGIDARLDVTFERIAFEDIPLIPRDEGENWLVSHSPLFNALDHDVKKAFWDKEYMRWEDIDSDIIIRYGYDFEGCTSPYDDFMLVSWTLRYPIMHVKARNARVIQGLKRMEQFEIERQVKQQEELDRLETIYSAIREKASDVESFKADVDMSQEDLRIAKVFESKGTPDGALKSDPENVLLSVISTVKLENASYDLQESKLLYMRKVFDLYTILGRSAELAEFARRHNYEQEIAAYSRTIMVPDALEIAGSDEKTDELLDFCALESIGTVVVDFTDLEAKRPTIEAFLKKAHRRNIKVSLRMGGEDWLNSPTPPEEKYLGEFFSYNDFNENSRPREKVKKQNDETKEDQKDIDKTVKEAAEEISKYARRAQEVRTKYYQRFDGIFIALTGRKIPGASQEKRISEIFNLAVKMRFQQKSAHPVTIDTAVPLSSPPSLLKSLLSRADTVALIDDKDSQFKIVDDIEAVLKEMDKGNVRGNVKVGLNVLPDKGKASFRERGGAVFYGEMAEISAKLRSYGNFAGILIEDYPHLRSMMGEK